MLKKRLLTLILVIWAQAAKMLKINVWAGTAVRLHTFETPSRGLEGTTKPNHEISRRDAQMNPGRKESRLGFTLLKLPLDV